MITENKVAIIMINYKDYASRFLADAYSSLQKLNYPQDKYRLFIVDNCSTPETVAQIKALAPRAIVISSQGNGWGHGNNVGAKEAMAQDFADYFYFVNMDTVFDSQCLRFALQAAKTDPQIGIVQSKILLYPARNNTYYLNSKGNALTFLGFSYCCGDGCPDDAGTKITDVVTASGVGLLIKKELFLKVNGCDETYFMYHDDLELSFKVKMAGYRLVVAPKSIIYHKHEFSRSMRQFYYMERNRFRFLVEFFKAKTLLLIFPAFVIMEIALWPYSLLKGWFIIKIKVYAYFLQPKNWFLIYKKRRQLQKSRQISDREMLKGVVGVVEYAQVQNFVLKYIANPLFDFYWRMIKKIIWW